jgi:uncharacterized integral membrane protein
MNTQPSVPAGQASEPTGAVTTPRTRSTAFTRLAAAWWALAIGPLILIMLLIFVARNTAPITAHFLGLHWSLPVGVGATALGFPAPASVEQSRKKSSHVRSAAPRRKCISPPWR